MACWLHPCFVLPLRTRFGTHPVFPKPGRISVAYQGGAAAAVPTPPIGVACSLGSAAMGSLPRHWNVWRTGPASLLCMCAHPPGLQLINDMPLTNFFPSLSAPCNPLFSAISDPSHFLSPFPRIPKQTIPPNLLANNSFKNF